jgi:hypothetical protein
LGFDAVDVGSEVTESKDGVGWMKDKQSWMNFEGSYSSCRSVNRYPVSKSQAVQRELCHQQNPPVEPGKICVGLRQKLVHVIAHNNS